MRDAVRLALGTLTILPVHPPQRVDRRTAGRAMVLAPVVGLLLGVLVLALVWLLGGGTLAVGSETDFGWFAYAPGAGPEGAHLSLLSPLVAAVVTVLALALLTRAMHLDGLADTADGLGSGKPAAQALEVMRRGDVGPFGVVTLVLVLMLQVAALQRCYSRGLAVPAVLLALVLSRAVLPALCAVGVPAARPDGLGATVAGSVSRRALAVSLVVALGAAVAVAVVGLVEGADVVGLPAGADAGGSFALSSSYRLPVWPLLHPLLTVLLPWGAAALLTRRCVRRLGGITGDVLGGCVEVAFTLCLLLVAMT